MGLLKIEEINIRNEYFRLHFVFLIFKHAMGSVKIDREPYLHKFRGIFIFELSPVVKQYHPLPSSIICKGQVQ